MYLYFLDGLRFRLVNLILFLRCHLPVSGLGHRDRTHFLLTIRTLGQEFLCIGPSPCIFLVKRITSFWFLWEFDIVMILWFQQDFIDFDITQFLIIIRCQWDMATRLHWLNPYLQILCYGIQLLLIFLELSNIAYNIAFDDSFGQVLELSFHKSMDAVDCPINEIWLLDTGLRLRWSGHILYKIIDNYFELGCWPNWWVILRYLVWLPKADNQDWSTAYNPLAIIFVVL